LIENEATLSGPDGRPARASGAKLLRIADLRVAFGGIEAVRGLSLDIQAGQTLGLVGESGCGKSVSWLAPLGLLGPDAKVGGSVRIGDEELIGADARTLTRLRGRRIAMVFQDPAGALNPMRSVGWQIDEVLRLHRGLNGGAVRRETCLLLERVGIPDPKRRADAYAHELSGGQNQRVAIAMALAGQPELLIADEPTTALDPTVQAQILDLLRDIQRETGMAMVLISHDLSVVSEICDEVAVMYAGELVERCPARTLFRGPAHPYTQALLAALPALEGPKRAMRPIRGSVPHGDDMPHGCVFAPRCDQLITACSRRQPLREIAPGHFVRCNRAMARL
jgi:peptide/nickel transport system ATP-binding protein